MAQDPIYPELEYNYEKIVAWNGIEDTGRDARLKLNRNFAQVLRNLEKLIEYIIASVDALNDVYLHKDRPDQTEFLQKFLGGIISTYLQSPEFLSGAMGHGFTLRQNEDGTTYAEIDKLMVRMKAIFQSLEIMKAELAGASFMFNASGARMTIVRTERFDNQPAEFGDGSEAVFSDGSRAVFAGEGEFESFVRCWFVADDGETAVENRFRVGNLVRSQTFNIKAGAYEGVSNRFWWREVVGVGDDYIDIAVARCADGSDLPAEGDVCVQFGDLNDIDYQSAIVLSAYGEGAPYLTMYQGINSYSLAGRDVFSVGYDRIKQECFLTNYGRAYIGSRDNTQYLEYRDGKIKVSADKITLGGKDVGVTLSDMDKEISLKVTSSDLKSAGIDIKEKTVKVTADKFYVSSTGGTPIAVFTTKNGKPLLRAEYIDVDNLKVKHLDGADGTFSGSLKAISGTFREIQSETDSSSYKRSMNIDATRIRFTDYQTNALFGTSTTSYASGSTAVTNIDLKGTVASGGYIGLCVSVTGNNYPGDLYRGNFALYIPKGQIRGFRPGVRRISANTTLNVMDTIVIVNRAGVALTLPDRPEDGQMYIIRNASSGAILVKSNKNNIKCHGDINMTASQVHNETGQTNIIFYDAVNDLWFPGYTNRW